MPVRSPAMKMIEGVSSPNIVLVEEDSERSRTMLSMQSLQRSDERRNPIGFIVRVGLTDEKIESSFHESPSRLKKS